LKRDSRRATAGAVIVLVATVYAVGLAAIGFARLSGQLAAHSQAGQLLTTHHAGPAPSPAPGAVATTSRTGCPLPIPTGAVLQQRWGILRVERGNRLAVQNPFHRNAIVKLRDVMLGDTRLALFVAANSATAYDRVPDGAYILEYAFGDALDESCTTFTRIAHAGIVGIYRPAPARSPAGTNLAANAIAIPDPDGQNSVLDSISGDTFNFN
jgi:hypothetical protein